MNMRQDEKKYRGLMVTAIFGLVALLASVQFLDQPALRSLVREDGLIEIASAAGYALVLLIMSVKGGWDFFKRHAYLFILVAAFGLRELDFHTRFTTMGIFKSNFYLSPAVPLPEKMIGALVCLALLACLILCLRKHLKTFLAEFRKETSSMSIGIALLFMAVSKGVDGLSAKLSRLGLELTAALSLSFRSMEEILELGIPMMLIVSTLAYFRERSAPPRS